jgi:hypothetical protein
MTPTLPTPAEELEIRQYSEEAWRFTWANCTELSPKQAFIEGHYLAFWCGIMACRKTRLEVKDRIERLETALSLSLLALVAAIAWGLAR